MAKKCGHAVPDLQGCEECRRAFVAAFAAAPSGRPAGGPGPTTSADAGREPLPCVNRGGPAPPPDGKPTARAWYRCDHPAAPLGKTVCSCRGCGPSCRGYAASAPDRVTRIDPALLAPSPDGRRFNCSLLAHRGRKLLAYRVGWDSPEIHIAELDGRMAPIGNTRIDLPHPKCHAGREDPRLFVFRERLHLSFAGLSFAPGGPLRVRVMLARLRDDLTTERVWEPAHPRSRPVEKNWQFFGYDDRLWCVYGVWPHRVLRVDYEAGTAADGFDVPWTRHSSSWPLEWEMRGGAPPVRVGGEFWHWFHGWRREKGREWYTYCAGVYAFEAKPPFKVTRVCPGPLWQPDESRNHLNITPDKAVIYPSGAVLDGDRWLVSAGHQDAECLVGEFSHAEIEKAMVPA